jgi:diguanylate cyclase (GGDEF)-like protein
MSHRRSGNRRSHVRTLFARREDPYRGVDFNAARRLGGLLWVGAAVAATLLLALAPPTAAIGRSGWAVAGVIVALALAGAVRLLRFGERVGPNELFATTLGGVAMIATLEWLAGGRTTPYHEFLVPSLIYASAVHPPRRWLASAGAYLAVTGSSALYTDWTGAQAGDAVLESVLTLALALLTLVMMDGVRTQRVTLHEQHEAERDRASSDSVTGLGNKRKLLADLEQARPTADAEPVLLVIYDLNGFKTYNDTYGHPAGDALLARLGKRLGEAIAGRGDAYRMGGDEFCLLVRGEAEPELIAELGRDALTEVSEGFTVSASCGWAIIDDPGAPIIDGLRRADEAMYAQKNAGRASLAMQSANVLINVISVRNRELLEHGSRVEDLSDAIAVHLGLSAAERAPLLQAAALHDVGKVGIPDAILSKPGALDETERQFMRKHTIIGERILAAAPVLAEAGKIVRSTHERYDGSGYPDGLVGEQIPVAARIIAVCDAYDVMTVGGSYRESIPHELAIAELRRFAGSQFDPAIVEEFCKVMAERRRLAVA